MPASPEDKQNERLERLEEDRAFEERRSEQLSGEIAELGRRVLELAQRLERLEGRMESMNNRVGELTDAGVVPPPHSAGPDVPRDPL